MRTCQAAAAAHSQTLADPPPLPCVTKKEQPNSPAHPPVRRPAGPPPTASPAGAAGWRRRPVAAPGSACPRIWQRSSAPCRAGGSGGRGGRCCRTPPLQQQRFSQARGEQEGSRQMQSIRRQGHRTPEGSVAECMLLAAGCPPLPDSGGGSSRDVPSGDVPGAERRRAAASNACSSSLSSESALQGLTCKQDRVSLLSGGEVHRSQHGAAALSRTHHILTGALQLTQQAGQAAATPHQAPALVSSPPSGHHPPAPPTCAAAPSGPPGATSPPSHTSFPNSLPSCWRRPTTGGSQTRVSSVVERTCGGEERRWGVDTREARWEAGLPRGGSHTQTRVSSMVERTCGWR